MSEAVERELLRERLEKLKDRANLQASAHAVLRDHYAFWNFWLTIGALVPTAALLMFPMVTDDFITSAFHMTPNAFKLINAAVALFAFVMVLLQMIWRPDALSKGHGHAIEHYTKFKFQARQLLEKSALDARAVQTLEEAYLDVRGLPNIAEDRFLALKQQHLRKLAISKRLDENPWLDLRKQPTAKEDPISDTSGKKDSSAS